MSTHTDNMTEYTFRGYHIPNYMMRGLSRYINKGIRPGQFLTVVLENNLHNAVSYADDKNLPNLPAYIGYLYNEAPGACWGCPEAVKAWIIKGGKENT